MARKRKKKKNKFVILLGVFLFFIGFALIARYIEYFLQSRESEDLAKEVLDDAISDEDDNYIYVDEDFLKIVQEAFGNKEVIGYIVYDGCNISYPIVKSSDNEEYLHLDINKHYSPFGTLFLDMSNKDDFSSPNSVIYGHHMKDGSMFGGLERYINKVGVENQSFYIYTRDCRKEYKVVASEIIQDSEENASKLSISTREEFIEWFRSLSQDSIFEDSMEGNFTTLITCHYSGIRVDRFGLTGIQINEKEYKVKEEED